MTLQVFSGNGAGNVAKDAKYVVRLDGAGKFKIGLLFRAGGGETWHMSTVEHPELVKMINKIKEKVSGSPGGAFYVNEYRQIVVPASDGVNERQMYLAGEYPAPLEFKFEGKTISTRPAAPDGTALRPGDKWKGPRVGIGYTQAAGGTDIRYESTPRPNVTMRVNLTEAIGKEKANRTLDMIKPHKRDGGAIYVNDALAIFAPITHSDPLEYVYCGQLSLDGWFPKS